MKIAIYCSANNNIDPDFFAMTEELGRWIGKENHTVVFGGCNAGLMESIARSTQEAGGRTIGVVPQIIEQGGRRSDYADIDIPCDNLSDRKDIMMAQADVFVALPGGIGTLDEVFTAAASATIGYHRKRVILYNMKGFWNSLIALMDDLQQRGFIRGDYHRHIEIANSLDGLKELLKGEE
ncbi:LOG family protein [Prevotella dentasini]|uniref:LOG family protein n=1 Tax=Prevotella dentasini TaxID=589537 RepID=UPI0004688DEC|nr:TIGR00730 family Rossman fold protein [Prevotella dentasini]